MSHKHVWQVLFLKLSQSISLFCVESEKKSINVRKAILEMRNVNENQQDNLIGKSQGKSHFNHEAVLGFTRGLHAFL